MIITISIDSNIEIATIFSLLTFTCFFYIYICSICSKHSVYVRENVYSRHICDGKVLFVNQMIDNTWTWLIIMVIDGLEIENI